MQLVYERCAGLDLHKKTVVACAITPAAQGQRQKALQVFSTMTPDLLRLRDWLTSLGVTHVAMESTGVFWKPIFTLLEGAFELLVATAQHSTAVPGRTTDVRAAEWIADLVQHGLLRPSFIPPVWQRQLRDLTRSRTSLIEERSRVIKRVQKLLEDANSKLASVAADRMGTSARQRLAGLVEGQEDPAILAEYARASRRPKRPLLAQALQGRVTEHHRLLLKEHLAPIDAWDERIEHLSAELRARLRPYEAHLRRLETIPGIKRRLAEVLLAEIGPDMSRFPSARHLASWAGMCPGNRESAGKRLSGKTRKGSPWVRSALGEAAHAATHSQECSLTAPYQRRSARRGGKKATMAVGHTMLVIVYHVLAEERDYRELGGQYFDEWERQAVQKQVVRRLEKLG